MAGGRGPVVAAEGVSVGIVRSLDKRVGGAAGASGGAPGVGSYFQRGNGVRLRNVHVAPVFWGKAWDDNAKPKPNPTVAQTIIALAGILGHSYFDGLVQYGVGKGVLDLGWATRSTTGDPPHNPTSNDEVIAFLNSCFDAQSLTPPDGVKAGNVSEVLYTIFLPPGWSNKDGPEGLHAFFDWNGIRAHFAWCTHGGSLDAITRIFSHELAEAVTDPEGDGITFTDEACGGDGSSWCEISDVCQSYSGRLNGIWVEAYWSQSDQACIIPTVPLRMAPRWWAIPDASLYADLYQREALVFGRDGSGTLHMFAGGDDKTVWTIAQTSEVDWGRDWHSLGGDVLPASDLAVVTNDDGRLEVFAHVYGGAIGHCWQVRTGGGWSDWESLGGSFAGSPRVARNHDGRLEVFACGSDHQLYHLWQLRPNGGWAPGWESLGGNLLTGLFVPPVLDVVANAAGRLDVFIRGSDAAIWHRWQPAPVVSRLGRSHPAWSEWVSLGNAPVYQITTTLAADAKVALAAASGNDGAMAVIRQSAAESWGQWVPLGGNTNGQIALRSNADGRLELFHIGTDKAVYHAWETVAGGEWYPWQTLSGIADGLGVGVNSDGRLEVVHVGTDHHAWHIWQVAANNGWNT